MEQKYSFDIKDKLGKGAYGKVYKGCLKSDKSKEVAIKVIERDGDFFSEVAEKELQILKSLQHVNIVTLLDDYRDNDHFFLVMEYGDAGNLEEFVKKQNPDLSQKLKLMHDCSKGVCFMHNQSPSIVHRDLKPQNILLKIKRGGEYVAMICDFGISRSLISDDKPLHTDCGTPNYRPPELMVKRSDGKYHYFAAADIFSLGLVYQVVLLYKRGDKQFEPLLVGYKDMRLIVASVMVQCDRDSKKLPNLFDINPDEDRVTASLKALIIRMTAFKATDRMAIKDVQLTLNILDGLNCENDSLKNQNASHNITIASLQRQVENLNLLRSEETSDRARLHDQVKSLQEENRRKDVQLGELTDSLRSQKRETKQESNQESRTEPTEPTETKHDFEPDPEDNTLDFAAQTDIWRTQLFVMAATIGIGMKYSSCGISFKESRYTILNWSDCKGNSQYEVPLSILTDDSGAFVAFGYEAEQIYSQLGHSDKISLFRGLDIWKSKHQIILSEVRATNGKSRRTMDIVSMALKYLKQHVLETVQKNLASQLDQSMIHWTVVIPSIIMHGGEVMKEILLSEMGPTFFIKEEPHILISCFEHIVSRKLKGHVLLIDIQDVNTIITVCRLPWRDGCVCETRETCGTKTAEDLLIAFIDNKILGSCAKQFYKSVDFFWPVELLLRETNNRTFINVLLFKRHMNQLAEFFGKNMTKYMASIEDDITFNDGSLRIENKIFKRILSPVVYDIEECALDMVQTSNNSVSSILIAGKQTLREMVKERLLARVPSTVSVATIDQDVPLVTGALPLGFSG